MLDLNKPIGYDPILASYGSGGAAGGWATATVELCVPLAALGFKPEAGKDYQADLAAVFSDATGTNRAARVYWSNKATGLVNDVPGEIMATPNLWGVAALVGEETP